MIAAIGSLAHIQFLEIPFALKFVAVIISSMLIALAAPRVLGENTRAAADDAYQLGLWDVAARKYHSLLVAEDAIDDARPALAIRLVECLVRDGNGIEALALLQTGQPAAAHPDAAFWRGQVLAGIGRFAEAVGEFDAHLELEDVPHRLEAALTSANLKLSLDNASGALLTLAAFAEKADPQAAARANLHRAAILLDSGYPEDARSLLPADEIIAEQDIPLARYARARLLLDEGDAESATGIFAGLLENPTGQSIAIHHGAALGLADAIHATAGPEAASRSLLAFLTTQPDTPLLDAAFRRLIEWLPGNPLPGDPILAKLGEWIPQPVQPATGLIPSGESVAAVWPANAPMEDIAAFAMFTRGVGLHRIDTPAARHEARALMTRLRVVFPNHHLARRSLLAESRWMLREGHLAAALHRLALAADASRTGAARAEAIFLEAMARADEHDEETATALFEEASGLLEAGYAEAARFNAALLRIREAPDPARPTPALSASLRAALTLERALAKPDAASALTALESFLRDHPQHPRVAEARLASAERAIVISPPDLSLARAQIDTLESTDGIPNAEPRIALVRLRLADLEQGDHKAAEAIAIARSIIEEFPQSPAATEAALTLGRKLFQSGDYNDARIAFERLAITNAGQTDADPALTQAAYLLAARAAALGATTQSREEALGLFDNAIAVEGAHLAGAATLEKARLMIDLNRLQPAIDFLLAARATMGPDDPLHLPAGILLGEAIYAKGAGDTAALEQALAIYDDLLARAAEDNPEIYHRLQYLRGITLEKLPRRDAPQLMRNAEAIEAYYSVIWRAGEQPPAEWEWFERCAFAALALLEKAERWQAAINLARKIAAFNGPRSADAAEHASQLQLKHMIWED